MKQLLRLSAALLLSLSLTLLPGCSSVSTSAAKLSSDPRVQVVLTDAEKTLGPVAVQAVFTAAVDELSGTKINTGTLISQALYTGINDLSSSSDAADLIKATAQSQTPSLVNAVTTKLSGSLTPQAVAALAGVISSAVGAPPAGTAAQAAASATK